MSLTAGRPPKPGQSGSPSASQRQLPRQPSSWAGIRTTQKGSFSSGPDSFQTGGQGYLIPLQIRERYLLGVTVIFPKSARCVDQEAEETHVYWQILGSETRKPSCNCQATRPFSIDVDSRFNLRLMNNTVRPFVTFGSEACAAWVRFFCRPLIIVAAAAQ